MQLLPHGEGDGLSWPAPVKPSGGKSQTHEQGLFAAELQNPLPPEVAEMKSKNAFKKFWWLLTP